MEPIQPLLAPTSGDVDQQASRRSNDDSGGTIGSGRLKSSPRVTTFLKVTGSGKLVNRRYRMSSCAAASLAVFLCPQDFWFLLIIRGALMNRHHSCPYKILLLLSLPVPLPSLQTPNENHFYQWIVIHHFCDYSNERAG
jgi:hypothetical protein